MEAPEAPSSVTTGNGNEKNYRYEVAFDNIITQEEEYTVTISTELNGRTVTQMVEKFPMGHPEPWAFLTACTLSQKMNKNVLNFDFYLELECVIKSGTDSRAFWGF